MEDYNSISIDSAGPEDLEVNRRALRVDERDLTNVIERIYEVLLIQVALSIFVLTVCLNLTKFTSFLTRIGGVVIVVHFFFCFVAYYFLTGKNDNWNFPLVSLLTCSLDLCFASFGRDLMLEVRKENISLAFVLVALIFYILKKKVEDGGEEGISHHNAKIISAGTALWASFAIHFYYFDREKGLLDLVGDMIRTFFLTLIYVFNLLYFTIDNPYTIQKYYPDRIVEGLVIIQFDLFTAIFLSILSIFSFPFLALIYIFDYILSFFN